MGYIKHQNTGMRNCNSILVEIDFIRCSADPCLYMYENQNENVYLVIHVDDVICQNHFLK